jgi:hypothetical protein
MKSWNNFFVSNENYKLNEIFSFLKLVKYREKLNRFNIKKKMKLNKILIISMLLLISK